MDPQTGIAKPIPYAYGIIQLDGADNVLSHYVDDHEESEVRIGARVEAVFEEHRTGTMNDIKHFRIID